MSFVLPGIRMLAVSVVAALFVAGCSATTSGSGRGSAAASTSAASTPATTGTSGDPAGWVDQVKQLIAGGRPVPEEPVWSRVLAFARDVARNDTAALGADCPDMAPDSLAATFSDAGRAEIKKLLLGGGGAEVTDGVRYMVAGDPVGLFFEQQAPDRVCGLLADIGALKAGGATPDGYLSATDASYAAEQYFGGLENGADVSRWGCAGPAPRVAIRDYRIGDVSPATGGTFDVRVTVTSDSGATVTVTVRFGARAIGLACIRSFGTNAPSRATRPGDVPSVPASGDPVPTHARPPGEPDQPGVVPWTSAGDTATSAAQLVEWAPSGLSPGQAAAVASIVRFMTYINQQRFARAWAVSTERLGGSRPDARFRTGYRTSRFYQVAFGQPRSLAADLVIVPARFVSRQDPAAQGSPQGVTGCTYWPQYVFVVARSGGQWLVDVAARYAGRPELAPFKRASDGARYLNPVQQRVSC